jgi:hypothetical protein
MFYRQKYRDGNEPRSSIPRAPLGLVRLSHSRRGRAQSSLDQPGLEKIPSHYEASVHFSPLGPRSRPTPAILC